MTTQDELVEALAKKDADFLEKFVQRVLNLSAEQWAKKVNEAFDRGPEGTEEYNSSFTEWHRLRMDLLAVEDEIAAERNRHDELPGTV